MPLEAWRWLYTALEEPWPGDDEVRRTLPVDESDPHGMLNRPMSFETVNVPAVPMVGT